MDDIFDGVVGVLRALYSCIVLSIVGALVNRVVYYCCIIVSIANEDGKECAPWGGILLLICYIVLRTWLTAVSRIANIPRIVEKR